jgi:hypothetical protein
LDVLLVRIDVTDKLIITRYIGRLNFGTMQLAIARVLMLGSVQDAEDAQRGQRHGAATLGAGRASPTATK